MSIIDHWKTRWEENSRLTLRATDPAWTVNGSRVCDNERANLIRDLVVVLSLVRTAEDGSTPASDYDRETLRDLIACAKIACPQPTEDQA